jgi:hypothetical protein
MEVLDDYEFPTRTARGETKYEALLDGRTYRLTLADYPNLANIYSLRQAVNIAARRRGLTLHSHLDRTTAPQSLVIRVLDERPPSAVL